MVLAWLSIFLSLLALAVSVQGQQGFLSIDCGIPGDLNYTDDTTRIFYTSDAKFIDTGTNKEIAAIHMTQTLPRQYQNLRIFPDGIRNCYTLTPVIKRNRYLLRASFMYGNYDGLDQPPQFDAYIGVDRWEIKLPSNSSLYTWNELIMVASLDYISVCLVNTGKGAPFISALELRQLDNSRYQAANESQSLRLYARSDTGSTSGKRIRYPDDDYDRIWSPWVANMWSHWVGKFTPISTSFSTNVSKDVGYQPALAVMNTAAMPTNTSENLSFYFPISNFDPRFQYHVFLHFAELEQLQNNQSREFNISMDGKSVSGAFSPKYLSVDSIFTTSPLSGQDQHVVELYKTTSSTLPPILNAVETFIVKQLTSPTDGQDVDAIMNIKAIYQIKRNWMGDPCLPVDYSWDGLNCSYPDSSSPTIISLDLSSSGLKGELASSLANLTSIKSLDVSNNSLTGHVPDFLAELSSLKILNLTNNQFTGLIPAILLEKSKDGSLSLSFDNNANHCQVGSCKERRKIVVPILASFISALVMLIIMVFVLWEFIRRRQGASIAKAKSGSVLYQKRQFTYARVVGITNNFEKSIGRGGFGTVYLGQMTNGIQVAVKMLILRSIKTPCQGSNEFENEVQLLTRVHHRNLVSFIGYCQEDGNMALIYEYMAQGNLGSHLSDNYSNALSWDRRLHIALDIAQGLEYLHDDCKPTIIHRDVKTANILLNERLEAKIGDFGLSRDFNDEFTYVSTAVKGTFGYLDPEYCNSNKLTEKSDVYSFGVVLLQLITGKPAIVRITNSERISLIDWAIPIVVGGDIRDVIDPKFEGNHDIKSIQKVAEIARACTSPKSINRPHMRDVVVELKEYITNEKALESAPKSGVNMDSGPAQTSSEIMSYLSAR